MSVACFYLFLAVHALIAWIEGRSRLAGGLTMLVFIAGAALYVVRESWGFAIFAPAMLPLLFAHPWRARIAWAAVGLVALTLVFVPARAYQKYLERTTDPEMSAWFFPRYLMLWQADVIRPVLQSKVAEGRAEPFEQRLNEIYDLEFARAAEPGAEIDPDPKFGYSPGRISVMMNEHLETASLAERSRILNELYEAGVKQHPLHFLAKVLGQLEYYYGLGAKIYPTNIHPAKARLASAFTALGPSYEAEVKLFHTASEMSRLKDPRDLIEKHPPRQVRVMLDGMDAVFSWMIIAFVAWLAWNLARGRRGIFWDRPRRRIALATGWILFVPFCVVLTFASISTLTTERFISQLLPLTLFSQICLAFYLGLEIKAIWRNNARPEVESEAIPPHGL